MGCECEICVTLDAACDRLVEAGICANSREANKCIKAVCPISMNTPPYVQNLSTLRALAGVHGATLYRILLIRRSDG